MAYFRDAGHPEVVDDATAWCAAFVGAMLKRAGIGNTGSLAARSYLKWGEAVDLKDAKPGDIVIFKRGNSTWQGHVAFFVARSGVMVRVLGGNQADAVNERQYPVAQLLGVRRAPKPVVIAAPAPKPVVASAPAKTAVKPAPAPDFRIGPYFARIASTLLQLIWKGKRK